MRSVHFPQPTSTFLTASSERQYSSVASLDCAGAEGRRVAAGSLRTKSNPPSHPPERQEGDGCFQSIQMFQVKKQKPKVLCFINI